MAIGFGPGAEMHRTVGKQRKLSSKRSLKDSSNATEIKNMHKGLKYKEASVEQLENIKADLKNANRRSLYITIIITLIVFGLVGYILKPFF